MDFILGTSASGLVPINAYTFIELKATVNDTTGAYEVRVNGTDVLSDSGVDTKNGGTNDTFDRFRFREGRGNVDDFYLLNGVDSGISGQPHNDFLGDCKVPLLMPDGDTATEDWALSAGSDSYALVDEVPPNDDTDYIEDDTAAEKTQLTAEDLAVTTDTVFGVCVAVRARKDDTGTALMRSGISSNAVAGNGADKTLSQTYETFHDIFDANPDGGGAWTGTLVNAAEPFVEVRT